MGQAERHLSGRQILIVEDDLIIAWQIQAMVESLGCVALGPVSSIEKALGLLRANAPDAALLDVNLHGVTVLPVAQECQRRNIPFVLITGYGRLPLAEPVLNDAVRVRKPFNMADIAKALSCVRKGYSNKDPEPERC
jgi:DNA-binding NtrC family response regulator